MNSEQEIRMWSMVIAGLIYGNKSVDFSEVLRKGIPEMIGDYITNNAEWMPQLFDIKTN